MSNKIMIIAILVAIALYFWYASVVARRNRVNEARADVDVQLNMRHDLVPNMLAIARKYMEHERSLFEEIAALRAKASSLAAASGAATKEKFAAEGQLDAGMGRLFAIAENYPALKGDGPMMEAQRGYQEVETNIAAARRFYNTAVTQLRNSTQVFPGPLLARLAGVTQAPPFFEVAESVRAPVDAATLLT